MGIVVIGAVFVDIKGYPLSTYIPGGRNAGRIEQVHGGVSRNVAEDIANVELRPTFVGLVDDTGMGQDVIDKLDNHKVNTRYIQKVPDGMGTWLAIFDNDGDVHAAISKRPDTTPLTTLLENMLELSRLVSSEEPLPLAETDLGLLCAERLQIQRELSQNPSVEYVLKGGGRGTCVIPTNETYMTRVIDNLLQNAAKFTAAGSVTVCCDKDDRTRKLRIRVTDTGIGIAPDKQEWVFDRFTKVDSFKPGSGIGLYLCRLIVTRLGGAIRVCPDYRAGCCIEITLPY